MIDSHKIQQLESAFQRILILPVSRSTFRQMQNAILYFSDGDRDLATLLLDSLLSRQNKLKKEQIAPGSSLQQLIDNYSLKLEVAREVAERGEFLSIVTSDIITHPQMFLFGTRIRRIDGKEFEFISDMEGIIQIMHHFTSRIQELERAEKEKNILKGRKPELRALKNRIDQLLEKATD